MNSKTAVVFGSVKSSDVVLRSLIKADVSVKKVYSLDEQYSSGVSGYYPIHNTAAENGIPFRKFHKINDEEILNELREIKPDYMFVVGLSQLVSKEIMDCAKEGVIGLHPAPLPKYRGRAAMVWQMLLGEKESAVSLFFIDEGMDSGDIIVQVPFTIEETDYAIDVDNKGLEALSKGIDIVSKMIAEGNVSRTKQDESKATYLLKRTPEDGEIDWNQPIKNIHTLIRAVSRPFPGAYSYLDGVAKLVIWRADMLENSRYFGIPGQICNITDSTFDVVCRDGLLHVYDYQLFALNKCTAGSRLIEGHKLRAEKML